MSEIKPCPFCGKEAIYGEDNQYSDRHVIECQNCGTNRRSEYGYEDVLSDWNQRYDSKGNKVVENAKPKFRPVIRVHRKSEPYTISVWSGVLCDTEEGAKDNSAAIVGDFFFSSGAEPVEVTE